MVGDYEWVTLGDHLEAHTILTDLTRQTGKQALANLLEKHGPGAERSVQANLLPDLSKEVAYALQSELDGCAGKDNSLFLSSIPPNITRTEIHQ